MLRGKFRNSTGHPIETVIKCLIGHQIWKPVAQVLFSEVVNILDEGILLLITDKEINCKNFLVGEPLVPFIGWLLPTKCLIQARQIFVGGTFLRTN